MRAQAGIGKAREQNLRRCFVLLGRMIANQIKHTPQVLEGKAVQMKRLSCRPPDCRNPANGLKIGAASEMILPCLLARMKKRNGLAALRVACRLLRSLMIVAAAAAPRKIF